MATRATTRCRYPAYGVRDPLYRGLVGYWPFSEGRGQPMDWSGNKNHSVITGATWEGSERGTVLDFDGINYDYVRIPEAESLKPTADGFGVGMWLKYRGTGTDSFCHIYSNGTVNGTPSCNMYVDTNDDGLTVWWKNDAGVGATGSDIAYLAVGEWIHLVTVAVGGRLKVYLNGLEIDDRALPAPPYSNLTDWLIGAEAHGSPVDSLSMQSSDISFYARGLSSDEIKQLYARSMNRA